MYIIHVIYTTYGPEPASSDLSIFPPSVVPMADRLAIAMQKGGVGKSTTAINLSGALATAETLAEQSDVLLVDADPQGFATITLGSREYYVSGNTVSMYDIMLDFDRFEEVNDIIQTHDEFDVLPAHGSNFKLERELWSANRSLERLDMVLDEIDSEYDYIVIDSPPNLGPLADGAILAAENVLFVSRADSIATFSMNLLTQEISQLEREFDREVGVVGAVVNALTRNKISDERLEWFLDNLGEENTFIVPETVAIEGAFNQNYSVYGFEPTNRHREEKAEEVRDIYDRLATRVEAHYA
jgi:chromosome partitioning protein